MKKELLDNEDKMILMLNTCFILTNNKESVINQASGVWRTLYHLNQPSIEVVEIKDDDSSDNEEDESNNIPVTQSELLEVMKEGEEEDKEEEALEVMEMDDTVRIASALHLFLTLHQTLVHQWSQLLLVKLQVLHQVPPSYKIL